MSRDMKINLTIGKKRNLLSLLGTEQHLYSAAIESTDEQTRCP